MKSASALVGLLGVTLAAGFLLGGRDHDRAPHPTGLRPSVPAPPSEVSAPNTSVSDARGARIPSEGRSAEPSAGAVASLADTVDSFAALLRPGARPTAPQVVDFLCGLTRTLDGSVSRERLTELGVDLTTTLEGVVVKLPVRGRTQGVAWMLEVTFGLEAGGTELQVRRLPAGGIEDAVSLVDGRGERLEVTRGLAVDFGEWRLGPWTWEHASGFVDPVLDHRLEFYAADDVAFELEGLDRDCLTSDVLNAWAAALPWTGSLPPRADEAGDWAPFLRAANALAADLDPERVPSIADLVRFTCALLEELERDPKRGASVGLDVRAFGNDLEVLLPVDVPFDARVFRAAFLRVRLDLQDPTARVLHAWRELVPRRPVDPTVEPDLDLFRGLAASSSWVALDLDAWTFRVGDVHLRSRRVRDWHRGPARPGLRDVPCGVGPGCLWIEALEPRTRALLATLAREAR